MHIAHVGEMNLFVSGGAFRIYEIDKDTHSRFRARYSFTAFSIHFVHRTLLRFGGVKINKGGLRMLMI